MKKSRRLLLLLLVLTLTLSLVLTACGGGEQPVDEGDTTEQPVDEGDETEGEDEPVASDEENQVIIGNTSELSGDWGAPHFQNNAADRDIIEFITGYRTYENTFDGEFLINETAVENFEEVDNDDGSKTLTYTIVEGLKFADGKPITAENYVAHALFWNSEVVAELDSKNTANMRLVGWSEYAKGETNIFKGVRLLDENTFSLTVAAEELPNFYVLTAGGGEPLDLEFWTDDTVTVHDDGEGAYLSDNFTVENFGERITACRREVPRPSSGPYQLREFDEGTKVAILDINENYIGNYEGQVANIETVIYKHVNQETIFDELETGQVDLVMSTAGGDEINKGLDMVSKGGFDYVNYDRSGYGKLTFACDFGPTADAEVRQAIAHLLDRNEFAKSFTSGYGSVVNGPYGEAHWFYKVNQEKFNKELNAYSYNLDAAMELLDSAGWNLDAQGNAYTEGLRHKKDENGDIVPLEIEWCSSEDNEVSELLVVMLQENPDLEKAGIKINQTTMTFPELLNYYYREGEDAKYEVPTYHMFNLASGFPLGFIYENTYSTDPVKADGANLNFIFDEDLSDKAAAINRTEFDDKDGYAEKFADFIIKWNELLPDVPLYSNIYHDFFNDKIENYENNDFNYIARAILYANVVGH